jgi:hypothetical protein
MEHLAWKERLKSASRVKVLEINFSWTTRERTRVTMGAISLLKTPFFYSEWHIEV